MASYVNFLGRRVTVSYRVGDVLLPASGTFVGDSGRSIFLEQHLEQRGRLNYFRWEIPYPCIHRIAAEEGQAEPVTTSPKTMPSTDETAASEGSIEVSENTASLAASAASGASGLLPLSHRPKTA
jgi:hypothetical protein